MLFGLGLVHHMLHTITFFGTLGVIPLLHRADQITGNTTDALKLYAFTKAFCIGLGVVLFFHLRVISILVRVQHEVIELVTALKVGFFHPFLETLLR